MYDRYKDQGFLVLGISIDTVGIEAVQKYMQALELTFPTVYDPKAKSAGDYGVRGVPTTFFIDTEGNALGGVFGPREWDSEDFHTLVELLLTEAKQGESAIE